MFFFIYPQFKDNLKEEGEIEQIWKLGSGCEGEGGLIVTCHLIQLNFNLQRLEESHSENDCGRKAMVQKEGSWDFSRWYLLTNHLDMNYSPPNGNPYSSSFPKPLLRGWGWEAAFISSSYPLPHPCSLIKTPAILEDPTPSAHSYWISSASPLSLWTIFGIINDTAPSYTYEYGDQP